MPPESICTYACMSHDITVHGTRSIHSPASVAAPPQLLRDKQRSVVDATSRRCTLAAPRDPITIHTPTSADVTRCRTVRRCARSKRLTDATGCDRMRRIDQVFQRPCPGRRDQCSLLQISLIDHVAIIRSRSWKRGGSGRRFFKALPSVIVHCGGERIIKFTGVTM